LFFFSNEQIRLSNSDTFLLLLNNTSRSIRTQFRLQENNSSNTIAHIYKTKFDDNNNINQNLAQSMTDLSEDLNIPHARRVRKMFNFLLNHIFKSKIDNFITNSFSIRINVGK